MPGELLAGFEAGDQQRIAAWRLNTHPFAPSQLGIHGMRHLPSDDIRIIQKHADFAVRTLRYHITAWRNRTLPLGTSDDLPGLRNLDGKRMLRRIGPLYECWDAVRCSCGSCDLWQQQRQCTHHDGEIVPGSHGTLLVV